MPRKKPAFELPAHVHCVNAKGRTYYYFQRGRGTRHAGPRTRLPGDPHSAEFWAAHNRLAGHRGAASKTFHDLIAAYKASPNYEKLAPATRRLYSRYLDVIAAAWGQLRVSELRPKHVIELRDAFSDRPTTANLIVKVLATIIKWGIPREFRDDNPCRHIEPLETNAEHAKPWPDWAFRLVEKYGPEDVRRFIHLGEHTGQRSYDVLRMSPRDMEDGGIWVTQQKTGKKLWVPLKQTALATIQSWKAEPFGPFVRDRAGRAYSMPRWQQTWQRFVRRNRATALLRKHRLSPHGLRATATGRLRKVGCNDLEIGSITGMSLPMIRLYTSQADQKQLARAAVNRLERARNSGL